MMNPQHRPFFILAAGVFVAGAIGVFVLINVLDRTDRNATRAMAALQSQRVLCALSSRQIESARTLLLRSAALRGDRAIGDPRSAGFRVVSGQFARFLEHHGYPGPRARVAEARKAAVAFAIDNAAYIRELAPHVRGLVKRDGGLNCDLLARTVKP